MAIWTHDIASGRYHGIGIAKSKHLASTDRSDFEGMVILPAKFSELMKA